MRSSGKRLSRKAFTGLWAEPSEAEGVFRSVYRARAMDEISILKSIKTIRQLKRSFPCFTGIFSISHESLGYMSFSHTTAAIPQKKQNSRLMRPPRLKVKPL